LHETLYATLQQITRTTATLGQKHPNPKKQNKNNQIKNNYLKMKTNFFAIENQSEYSSNG
jgi:hypothetical protein